MSPATANRKKEKGPMDTSEARGLTYGFPEREPDARLRELMLYIAEKCSDDIYFGAIKLNKILYFSDFISYLKYGEPITGAEYIAVEHGPVPKRLVPIRTELEREGAAVLQKRMLLTHEQHRLIPLRAADLSLFSARDIALVDEVIQQSRDKTATELSILSHGVAWMVPQEGESIPYEAAFLSDEPITNEDVGRAQELVNEYGWAA